MFCWLCVNTFSYYEIIHKIEDVEYFSLIIILLQTMYKWIGHKFFQLIKPSPLHKLYKDNDTMRNVII